MNIENNILAKIPPQDVVISMGLDSLTIKELLKKLKEGRRKIVAALKSPEYGQCMDAYLELGREYGPIALALFEQLSKEEKEPRISIYLACNRHAATGCFPDAVLFWADVDAVTGLYDVLKKDGYYGKK